MLIYGDFSIVVVRVQVHGKKGKSLQQIKIQKSYPENKSRTFINSTELFSFFFFERLGFDSKIQIQNYYCIVLCVIIVPCIILKYPNVQYM